MFTKTKPTITSRRATS